MLRLTPAVIILVIFFALPGCTREPEPWLASADSPAKQGRFNCLFGDELHACQAVVSTDPRFKEPGRGW